MLVLTRKTNEEIILILSNGDRIKITAVACLQYRTRIGIDAPDDVEIVRGELLEKD